MKIYFLLLALFGLSCELNAQNLTKAEAKNVLTEVSQELKKKSTDYRDHAYYNLGILSVVGGLYTFGIARDAGAELPLAIELGTQGLALGSVLGAITIFSNFFNSLICELQADAIDEAVKAL